MSTHPRSSLRDARTNGAITVVLFLASCLLVVPVVQLFFGLDAPSEPQEYKFRPTAIQSKPAIVARYVIDPFEIEIAQFESVEGQPDDSLPLRNWLAESPCTPDMRVLELGTSTGVIAITCSAAPRQILSLESNPQAIANARFNAQQLQLTNIEWRLTQALPASPFSVVLPQEQFDRIVVTSAWEKHSQLQAKREDVATTGEFAPDHWPWIQDILRESASHLRTGGCMAVAGRDADTVSRLVLDASLSGWQATVIPGQPRDTLAEGNSPGYVLVLRPTSETSAKAVSPAEKFPSDNLLK